MAKGPVVTAIPVATFLLLKLPVVGFVTERLLPARKPRPVMFAAESAAFMLPSYTLLAAVTLALKFVESRFRLAALMLARVMFPAVLLVLSVLLRSVILTEPLPALMLVPAAMVMAAAPGSRLASITPLAAVSLPISVKLPLSVVMLALTRIERPACMVSAPPLPPGLLARTAPVTVISLLACRVTVVPALSRAVRSADDSVLVPVGLVAKVWGLVRGVVPTPTPIERISTRPV